MKSSANLSASPPSDSGAIPARISFALGGHSVALDPRRHAVRSDLADIRLADRVFAPHYAAPMILTLAAGATLREGRAADSGPLAQLCAGDMFEVLELDAGAAWGVAPGCGMVGYIDARALGGIGA